MVLHAKEDNQGNKFKREKQPHHEPSVPSNPSEEMVLSPSIERPP